MMTNSQPKNYTKAKNQQPHLYTNRDNFQTPSYATDLLVPFIPSSVSWIWEPAAGKGKITDVLRRHNYKVHTSDVVRHDPTIVVRDFLSKTDEYLGKKDCIITNPPYSLKKEFYFRCIEIGVPFALLVPADYCGWIIDAIRYGGVEKIVPTRRIDFITPNMRSGVGSSSNFHSMWITKGFGLGQSETFAELSIHSKKHNI